MGVEHLHPAVTYIDVELVRRVLIDHLAAQAATIGGRTAIPLSSPPCQRTSFSGIGPWWRWASWERTSSARTSFCAKVIATRGTRPKNAADRPGHYFVVDPALPTVPCREQATTLPPDSRGPYLVCPVAAECHGRYARADTGYRRERALGRQHPEWFKWVKTYVDWLVLQQRKDGSFRGGGKLEATKC